MRVAVFGAGGRAGRAVVQEAALRGHDVVAVVRDASRVEGAFPEQVEVARADVTDPALVKGLAGQADVLVLTVGGPDPRLHQAAFENVTAAVEGLSQAARPRIVHMGGGGSLLDADGVRFVDRPDFPEHLRETALAQAAVLDAYRRLDAGIEWTYVSPPPANLVIGERLGQYRTGDEHPVVGVDGESRISYDDFAVALVDEVEQPRHMGRRLSVGY